MTTVKIETQPSMSALDTLRGRSLPAVGEAVVSLVSPLVEACVRRRRTAAAGARGRRAFDARCVVVSGGGR